MNTYNLIMSIFGHIFLLIIVVYLAIYFINKIKFNKMTKEAAQKIHDSNFLQETFKPMTDEEKERMEKDGKAETTVTYDLNTNKVKTSNDAVKFEETVMHYVAEEKIGSNIKLIIDYGDRTGDVLYDFYKDSNKTYMNTALFDKYKFNKVINHKVVPGSEYNYLCLLIDINSFYVPESVNEEV